MSQRIRPSSFEVWTPEQHNIIRRLYPIGGAEGCQPLLPGRTLQAIVQRAKRLGVKFLVPWTKQEDDLLTAGYPAGGIEVCKILFQDNESVSFNRRTERSIRARVVKLGLRLDPDRPVFRLPSALPAPDRSTTAEQQLLAIMRADLRDAALREAA